MTLQDFVSRWKGKYLDFDGFPPSNPYQCVDLARQYWKDVCKIAQPRSVKGASDFWTNYPTDPNLNQNFDRIDNAPNNHPNAGDVIIWSNKAGGGFGHIAICLSANASSFTSFDQNYPTGAPCGEYSHNYTHVLGWFSRKGASMGATVQVPSETFEELVRKSTAWDEHQKTPCMTVKEYNAQMASKQAEIDLLYQRIEQLETQIAGHTCPTTPQEDGWTLNGKTVTVISGNTTTTYNYKKD